MKLISENFSFSSKTRLSAIQSDVRFTCVVYEFYDVRIAFLTYFSLVYVIGATFFSSGVFLSAKFRNNLLDEIDVPVAEKDGIDEAVLIAVKSNLTRAFYRYCAQHPCQPVHTRQADR